MKPEQLPSYDGPTFCPRCGLELVVESTGFRGYSVYTGKSMMWCKVVCPNRRHWWDGHMHRTRDYNSNRFFFYRPAVLRWRQHE